MPPVTNRSQKFGHKFGHKTCGTGANTRNSYSI
nr:MAG TPA: hypothetical protein [Caudoviricetes sp.]